MRHCEIQHAKFAAERFLKCVEKVRKHNEIQLMTGTKDTGELRRSSMELTRALSKMRNPNLWDK